ncbi:uncharacterized protein LOC129952511 [Eupeodes corollae]|uniref:uncharacterized protein LOC129952511 n=1 Tax=Eupeodes corollae TaxID=290404 RepID=UPI002491D33F|nr:uncharacterized protein LOC129952511 [Eupeodes corollae]
MYACVFTVHISVNMQFILKRLPVNMKSSICFVFLLTVFVGLSFGAVSIQQFKDPKHPGKCTINTNLVLSPGETIKYPADDCGQFICGSDSFAEYQTCVSEYYEGCVQGDYLDISLPYPDCCKRKLSCK